MNMWEKWITQIGYNWRDEFSSILYKTAMTVNDNDTQNEMRSAAHRLENRTLWDKSL